jgi:SsrA-binding protein
MEKKQNRKLIAQNKKASHDYFIEDTYQAGIALTGTEVKSLRAGKCNLKESYVAIEGREAFIENMHISPYEFGNVFNKDPLRKRKLLLHRSQINRLQGAVTREGYTIVPVKIYLEGSLVKLDIALAKGKKLYDKRHAIAAKDQRREAEKEFKVRNL